MKVHELLADPSRWTKGSYACDKNGKDTFFDSEKAVCFCLAGAVNKCYSDRKDRIRVFHDITETVKKNGFSCIEAFNDSDRTTHQDVLELAKKLDI